MSCGDFSGDAVVVLLHGEPVWRTADPRLHVIRAVAKTPGFLAVYRLKEPCPERPGWQHAVRHERPLPA